MLVSIIIPVFNCQDWLTYAISSAINQEKSNIEVIIINDGSTDNSLKVATNFISDKVKLFSQENRGASSARNLGLKYSKGDYIQFLDGDDILSESKIKKQIEILQNEGDNCVASGKFLEYYSFENTGEVYTNINKGLKNYENPIDWLVESMWDRAMFPPVVWLTPRKLIEEAGPWNESLSYNDDTEFFARVLLKARKIVFCEDAISYYRRGVPTSLGSRKDRQARVSELESLNLVTSHMLNFEDSLRVREACAYKYRKLIYSLYPDHRDLIEIAWQKLKELNVKGDFNFGNGFTRKLGSVIGWKSAKLIQRNYRKIRGTF